MEIDERTEGIPLYIVGDSTGLGWDVDGDRPGVGDTGTISNQTSKSWAV